MTNLGSKEILARNLNRFVSASDMDRKAIAEKIGVKYSTFLDWCNARSYPRIDKIELISNYFGIMKSDLIEATDDELYGRLASMKKNIIRVPLLGKVPAGNPIEAIEDQYTVDYEEIPAEWGKGDKKYFALKLSGDSMEPTYSDGDTVIFLKTSVCSSGQDCCIRINGSDATFKHVTIKENGILISPLNVDNSSGFMPKLYSQEQMASLPIEIIGVAKKHIRYIK